MQKKMLKENKFAPYVPRAGHSVNLLGGSAVDCCAEAPNALMWLQPEGNF